ncbi:MULTISPECIES: hypothetical protein [unclassified Streptomyces]|uniref:hypothetical protein n=1 Tax=unclassified Streptomyces TaxID=2593676 RepID=UPI0033BEF88B
MALLDYLTLGGVEIANHVRLSAYLESVGSPLDSAGACVCPSLTAEMLGDEEYTDPAADEAPWYDPDVPASAEFAGLMVLSIDGLDDHPVARSVTTAITGGGVLGPARVLPRSLTVTGILLGSTCCGVEYGWHWLTEALQGCAGTGCEGDCMELFACCPALGATREEFEERERRTLRRVALTSGPTVIERAGDGCSTGGCNGSADILTVEFVLTAATPWLWSDPLPITDAAPPVDLTDECITWCLTGGTNQPTKCIEVTDFCPPGALSMPVTNGACVGGLVWPVGNTTDLCACRLAACPDPTAACADPYCRSVAPPAPTSSLRTCFCLPLAVERACYDIDLSSSPGWAVDVPTIVVRAGSGDIRNLGITFYERSEQHGAMTAARVADTERCNPLAEFHVTYVPAGGAVTIDGQVQRATVECGGRCEASRDTYGRDGVPLSFPGLSCASYVICLETDVTNPPAADALVSISVSGRGLGRGYPGYARFPRIGQTWPQFEEGLAAFPWGPNSCFSPMAENWPTWDGRIPTTS